MDKHERPYGCTFLPCGKTFRSKKDWKRHENSQHFQFEAWRCDLKRPEGGDCAKVCYRRQSFQEHLGKEHLLTEKVVLDKQESCRIGRNGQSRFWCGFCVRLVDLRKRGLDAWTERFDHIDDHFMGRQNLTKSSISDWIPVDGGYTSKDDTGSHSGSHKLPETLQQRTPVDDSYKFKEDTSSYSGSHLLSETLPKVFQQRSYPPICDTGVAQSSSLHTIGSAPIKTEPGESIRRTS